MKSRIIVKVNGEKTIAQQFRAVLKFVWFEGEIIPALVARTVQHGEKLPSESGRRCRELVKAQYFSRGWIEVAGVYYKQFWLTKRGEKALEGVRV